MLPPQTTVQPTHPSLISKLSLTLLSARRTQPVSPTSSLRRVSLFLKICPVDVTFISPTYSTSMKPGRFVTGTRWQLCTYTHQYLSRTRNTVVLRVTGVSLTRSEIYFPLHCSHPDPLYSSAPKLIAELSKISPSPHAQHPEESILNKHILLVDVSSHSSRTLTTPSPLLSPSFSSRWFFHPSEPVPTYSARLF